MAEPVYRFLKAIEFLKEACKFRHVKGAPRWFDPPWKWIEHADHKWPSVGLKLAFNAMAKRISWPPHFGGARTDWSPSLIELLSHIEKSPEKTPADLEKYSEIFGEGVLADHKAEVAYHRFVIKHLRWAEEHYKEHEALLRFAKLIGNIDLNKKLALLLPKFSVLPTSVEDGQKIVKREKRRAYTAKSRRKKAALICGRGHRCRRWPRS